MSRVSEQISKANATSQGRPDANLANDSLHLGGIEANDYATKQWVRDYHDGKESTLKQYIDTQDASVLEQAKEYTNSQIRNQDFSDFAGISDLQALNNNLTSQIEQGLNAQKQYIDSKTQAIVDDVNANFQDVNGAISTLNGNVNNLFQSVSNGKSVIAEAITDKGVPTSASDSYSTMASNIRNIPSGGGSIDPNYVNTSDGTATPEDIRNGKTAYVKGQKIYGTLIAEAAEGYPTYGTDTSNATATAEDIKYGKTAYARGQLITGTLRNTDVEEIYGINADSINLNGIAAMISKDPYTDEDIYFSTDINKMSFSKELNYVVRIEEINSEQYIGSYPVNENGLYILASQTGPKKYRYSKTDLGIGTDETIDGIKLGHAGGETPLLFVLTKKEDTSSSSTKYFWFIYIFTYHLRENGVIGKEYENEFGVINIRHPYSVDSMSNSRKLYVIPKNTNMNEFYIGYINDIGSSVRYSYLYLYEILTNPDYSTQEVVEKKEYSNLYSSSYSVSYEKRILSEDDKVLYNIEYVYNDNCGIIYIDEDNGKIYSYNMDKGFYNSSNKKYYKIEDETDTHVLKEYLLSIVDNELQLTLEKTVTLNIEGLGENYQDYIYFGEKAPIVTDSYILAFPKKNSYWYCCAFKAVINSIGNGETITASSINMFDDENLITYCNTNASMVLVLYSQDLKIITFEVDTSKIIALKYNEKMFYSLETQQLTASASDVRTGKTFIGFNGIPEAGTMQVTEVIE